MIPCADCDGLGVLEAFEFAPAIPGATAAAIPRRVCWSCRGHGIEHRCAHCALPVRELAAELAAALGKIDGGWWHGGTVRLEDVKRELADFLLDHQGVRPWQLELPGCGCGWCVGFALRGLSASRMDRERVRGPEGRVRSREVIRRHLLEQGVARPGPAPKMRPAPGRTKRRRAA